MAAENALWLTSRNQAVDWGELITFRMLDWYACGVFVPGFIWATRRWPLDRRHLVTRFPLHLAIIVGASVAKIVLYHYLREALGIPAPMSLAQTFAGGMISEVIAFAATAGVIHAIVFYGRYREREALSAQLQVRLTDAQLRALRAQLNPHFLFNTLNAITTLLHRDPHRADAMLTRLGELLRLTLRADPDHEIPLGDELIFLDKYLEIMSMRFMDRVSVSQHIEPDVARALVPSFVLQPIVENAFEHGIAKMQSHGHIAVDARLAGQGTQVVLSVRDDGPGPDATLRTDGVGIANTRRRLEAMYGALGILDLSPVPGGGTLVEMRFPFRAARTIA
jgi:two-component system, LytTR family, sensor kinase